MKQLNITRRIRLTIVLRKKDILISVFENGKMAKSQSSKIS
jgi:hypothetical protein